MKPRSVMAAVVLNLCALVVAGAQTADGAREKKRTAGPRPEDDQSKVAAKRAPDKVVTFKRTPQGELKAHVYFPPGWSAQDQRPAIVFWVGGGFRSGGIGQFSARADYFSARGLVTVCAEYRGRASHGIELDSCAEDARSAMRWVKGRAPEFGIDPDKVIAAGGSAGGTLSLLVAREEGKDGADDDRSISPRPSALLLFNPAVGENVLRVVGWGGPEQAAVNAQVMALDTPQLNEPPSIIFFGTEDHTFLAVASTYHSKAHAQGTRCEIWIADEMRHGFFNNQPWHDATTRLADAFLVSLGYLKGPSPIAENPAAMLTRVGAHYVPPEAPAAAAKPTRKSYDIPAGPAESALELFAAQAAQPVIFSPDVLRDSRTNVVQGQFDVPRPVIDRMLAGTGLKAKRNPAGEGWIISRVAADGTKTAAPAR